jgi:uncharacterized protein (DUF2235 family)
MAKNILILSDGTGQSGGQFFDERRSNIYKLYRATRCAPDSSINPAEQVAFYDPGIGTLPPGLGFFGGAVRWVHNLISQATGLGLTANIIDCYTAIIRLWQPGDRIFIFGFSRGAYTARCVASVLARCGVPTQMKDGSPLKRDDATARNIAKEAVKKVYQHVSSPRDEKYVPQRDALAKRFRAGYGSEANGKSNTFPHFVGVFDTVAAIGSYGSMGLVALLMAVSIAALATALWLLFGSFWFWIGVVTAGAGVLALILYVVTHIKVAFDLEGFKWWQTLHLTEFKLKFYDRTLNENVGWARHALAVDEHRADFDRVAWGGKDQKLKTTGPGEPEWLQQYWFAGNHSDIGGSYPETESRLSDISLKWMVEAAQALPGGLKVDNTVLQLFPSPDGMQHDECRGLAFRFAKKLYRPIRTDGTLHESVYERFKLDAVQQYDLSAPYRPENLREHGKLKQYY